MNVIKKATFFILIATFLIGCVSNPVKVKSDRELLVGNWAMTPMKNGIANVAVFKKDGTSELHVFVCEWTKHKMMLADNGMVEKGRYSFDELTKIIDIKASGESILLRIDSITNDSLTVTETSRGDMSFTPELTYEYSRKKVIEPNCARETNDKQN